MPPIVFELRNFIHISLLGRNIFKVVALNHPNYFFPFAKPVQSFPIRIVLFPEFPLFLFDVSLGIVL